MNNFNVEIDVLYTHLGILPHYPFNFKVELKIRFE